jgi:hypothetical protein
MKNNPHLMARMKPQINKVDPALVKDWNMIYPAYINKNFSLKQGRRISKEQAVENPNIQEMAQCL